jgi:hypothetical protein
MARGVVGFTLIFALCSTALHAEPDWTAQKLQRDIAAMKDSAAALRTAAGLPARPIGDRITLSVFGGFPPPASETTTLYSTHGGGWRLESVSRVRGFDGRAGENVAVTRSTVDSQTAARIRQLIADPQLYREPLEAAGTCTDQPSIFIEIHTGAHRREALRYSCPPPDKTDALLMAVWSAEAAAAATAAAKAAEDAAKAVEAPTPSRK